MNKNILKPIIYGLCLIAFVGCNNKQVKTKNSNAKMANLSPKKGYGFKYNLQKPFNKLELPARLNEISGLSYYKSNQLMCLHDESADIYIINYHTGELIKEIRVNIAGDYEGLEYVNGNVYQIRNDGRLIETSDIETSDQSWEIHQIGKVSSKNDIEGLGYDSINNSLLLAFKNKSSLKKEKKRKKTRCVYQFDLAQKKLIEEPLFCIDLKKLEAEFGKKNFMPSAIAYHPTDDVFYILSSVGNSLAIINRDGEVLHLEKLTTKLFKQAEGICFSPDGKLLFISNEGRSTSGNILVFDRIEI